jgi:two-component system, response regulator
MNTRNVIIAEDDQDDYLFISEIFQEISPNVHLTWMKDGEELTDHLLKEEHEMPSLVLLDLNMPRKDGRQALQELKADPRTRDIPVVVLTTSSADSDKKIVLSHSKTTFMTKPLGYLRNVELVKELKAQFDL